MRIIGGTWRSRQLVRPRTHQTRPMPDRVKAALFSMLGSYYDVPGRLPPLRVADVFAGSGALGLEALSRGAAMCWFYERDPKALASLRTNQQSLGADDRSAIVIRDGWAAAIRAPDSQPFDLILLDPPYRDSTDVSECGAVRQYLDQLSQEEDNRPVLVLHHSAKVHFTLPDRAPWRVSDERRFGTQAITWFVR